MIASIGRAGGAFTRTFMKHQRRLVAVQRPIFPGSCPWCFLLESEGEVHSPTTRRRVGAQYARRFDRRSFLSVDDLPPSNGNNDNTRPIPPTLDSLDEDEGFGAYEYEPDEYDLQHMMKQEDLYNDYGGPTLTEEDASASQADKESVLSRPTPRTMKNPQKEQKTSSPSTEEEETFQQQSQWFEAVSSPLPESSPAASAAAAIDEPDPADAAPAFLFDSIAETIPPTHAHAAEEHSNPDLNDFLSKASSGTGATTSLDMLKLQLDGLVASIHEQNGGKEFNVNSPRQVAQALFGDATESTKKDILEGMAAGGNRLADLVLQYRSVQQQIKRATRKQESIQKGTRVRSASRVLSKRGTSVGPDDGDPLILVDASSYIFRAYYSMPPIHRTDGLPTGATLGFCNMLNRLVLNRMVVGEQPRIVLIFDAPGKNFRHDLYVEYKANRQSAPVDLIPQFDLVRQAAAAYGIPQIEAPNYEADDVIATLSRMAGEEGLDTNVLSGDKDLMQLVRDRSSSVNDDDDDDGTSGDDKTGVLHMIDPAKMERVTVKEVVEKWGVGPEQLGDILALAGDSADNVPGCPGIGPKTAALLIQEFGSLERLLDNVDQIKQKGRRTKLEQYADQVRLSRALVELDERVPLEAMTLPLDQVGNLRMDAMDADRLLAFYDEMGFRDLKFRVKSRLDGVKGKRPQNSPSKDSRKAKVEVPKPEEFRDVPF